MVKRDKNITNAKRERIVDEMKGEGPDKRLKIDSEKIAKYKNKDKWLFEV